MYEHPPAFCPHPQCRFHLDPPPGSRWYIRTGGYRTGAFGRIQRYRCRSCLRGFSSQSLSVDYYAKRRVDYALLVVLLVSCAGTRAISRALGVSTATVANRLQRLARQAIAIHTCIEPSIRLSEPLSADGFESFVVSQYFPNSIDLLVGAASQYVFALSYAPLRRKGRMRGEQKTRREEVEQLFLAPPGAVQSSFAVLCERMLSLFDRSEMKKLYLTTDEHKAYCRAIQANRRLRSMREEGCFLHTRIPSNHPRVPGGPLFAVDYLERELRKDLANHVRETVRFARNVNDCLARLMVYLVHHNCKKVYRINNERWDKRTHAEVAGASRELVRQQWSSLWAGPRRFLSRERVGGVVRQIWLRGFQTPLREGQEYVPAYVRA